MSSLVIAFVIASSAHGADRKPNILFLISDDQRPDTIAALGNDVIKTPNLDALVRSGTSFTRAVSPNPLCVPSRAEILTGASGFRNGILPGYSNKLDKAAASWPRTLAEAGYVTWYVGKWHTTGRPSTWGYADTDGLYSSGGGAYPLTYPKDFKDLDVTGYRGWVFQTDDKKIFPEKGIGLTPNISSEFADAAIRLLNRRPDQPFFLHVNFTAPHDPLFMPSGYEGMYEADAIPLPPNYALQHPFDHGNYEGRDEKMLPWPRTPEMVKANLVHYYAIISHLDEQVGRIIAALRRNGQIDNTIIIYTADHGLAVGSHGLMGKQNMYEHTVNVPMIFAGPGIPRGQRRDAQMYLRDLFPTTCDLVGIETPGSVEGRSVARVIRGETDRVYDHVFCYFNRSQRMVRTDQWKLVYYPLLERYQLFDIVEDPYEINDRIGDARVARVAAELKNLLAADQKRMGDPAAP